MLPFPVTLATGIEPIFGLTLLLWFPLPTDPLLPLKNELLFSLLLSKQRS